MSRCPPLLTPRRRPRSSASSRARPSSSSCSCGGTCAERLGWPFGFWAIGRMRKMWCRRRCSRRSPTFGRSTRLGGSVPGCIASSSPAGSIFESRARAGRPNRSIATSSRVESRDRRPEPSGPPSRTRYRPRWRGLPERQRLVVQLFELDGFSGAEIGAMLGIPAGTVRWHLHEARRSLRELLAQFEESAG